MRGSSAQVMRLPVIPGRRNTHGFGSSREQGSSRDLRNWKPKPTFARSLGLEGSGTNQHTALGSSASETGAVKPRGLHSVQVQQASFPSPSQTPRCVGQCIHAPLGLSAKQVLNTQGTNVGAATGHSVHPGKQLTIKAGGLGWKVYVAFPGVPSSSHPNPLPQAPL